MKRSNLEITERFWGKKPTLIIKRIQTKNVNIIHKWLNILKCQYYTQVVKRLTISTLYTSG